MTCTDTRDRADGSAPTQACADAAMDLLCINTLRTLCIDQVEQARSGHPGTPMGAAPTACTVWQRFLRFDAADPAWPDRDRFVLSVGHASALLYALLHLCGVRQAAGSAALAVSMADLQSFRQAGSRCTGHPEHGWTAGVETTTGPLGQGVATSVGMAIAQAWLAATYNRLGFTLFDHRIYALAGDGDMMEGLSAEAASLAGHLRLAHLCWIYDCNHISIEGDTAITFTEDVAARFVACGWQVLKVADARQIDQLSACLHTFTQTQDRPTLVIVQSQIGYGAPHKQGRAQAHGEPLGPEEARAAKAFYGCDPEAVFDIPAGVSGHFSQQFGQRGAAAHQAWQALFAAYRASHPALAEQLALLQRRGLPEAWDSGLPVFAADARGLATRDASAQVLNAIAAHMPWLLGGAADLAPSTKTRLTLPGAGDFGPGAAPGAAPGWGADAQAVSAPQASPARFGHHAGRNLHFGVREHAMCAAANGMALSGLRVFVASFLVFSDFARGSLRLAAMKGLPVVHVWTHDSIAMGEDGPTHQPVEQLASLRALPGMVLLRPADANEVVEAWRVVMALTDAPACLVLTRQALPTLDRRRYASAAGVARGAYVLADSGALADSGSGLPSEPPGDHPTPLPARQPELILLASGSEVALCLAVHEQLQRESVASRVVSMPSWDLFERQDQAYRDSVLPPAVKARVSVEAAAALGWDRYVGHQGHIIALRSFGLSAPGPRVQAHFGFEVAHVLAAARQQLALHAAQA